MLLSAVTTNKTGVCSISLSRFPQICSVFGSCMPAIFMSLCNSHNYERLYFQKSIIENCFIEPYV